MNFIDELARLEEMRTRGTLSEDEFVRAKARCLDGTASPPCDVPAIEAVNRLRRSRGDRWIGGVCGGIAAATGIESWIWRLVLTVLALFGGTGVLLYLLLWIFVPEQA